VRKPHSTVLLGQSHPHEPLLRQRTHYARKIAGIKAQTHPERSQFFTFETNLPNQSRFVYWSVPVKKTVVHRTDSFGDRSIKTPDL
jgi:hypothetical protein